MLFNKKKQNNTPKSNENEVIETEDSSITADVNSATIPSATSSENDSAEDIKKQNEDDSSVVDIVFFIDDDGEVTPPKVIDYEEMPESEKSEGTEQNAEISEEDKPFDEQVPEEADTPVVKLETQTEETSDNGEIVVNIEKEDISFDETAESEAESAEPEKEESVESAENPVETEEKDQKLEEDAVEPIEEDPAEAEDETAEPEEKPAESEEAESEEAEFTEKLFDAAFDDAFGNSDKAQVARDKIAEEISEKIIPEETTENETAEPKEEESAEAEEKPAEPEKAESEEKSAEPNEAESEEAEFAEKLFDAAFDDAFGNSDKAQVVRDKIAAEEIPEEVIFEEITEDETAADYELTAVETEEVPADDEPEAYAEGDASELDADDKSNLGAVPHVDGNLENDDGLAKLGKSVKKLFSEEKWDFTNQNSQLVGKDGKKILGIDFKMLAVIIIGVFVADAIFMNYVIYATTYRIVEWVMNRSGAAALHKEVMEYANVYMKVSYVLAFFVGGLILLFLAKTAQRLMEEAEFPDGKNLISMTFVALAVIFAIGFFIAWIVKNSFVDFAVFRWGAPLLMYLGGFIFYTLSRIQFKSDF